MIDADEAAARLGIRRASLYAYVSRGLLRSVEHPTNPRARLYSAADIDGLLLRKARSRRPATAAATALDWGMPVLETGISRIEGGQLFYRDVSAVALAETATLEAVAALLWTGDMNGAQASGLTEAARAPAAAKSTGTSVRANAAERGIAALAPLLPDEVPGLGKARQYGRGGHLVRALATAVANARLPQKPLHEALATAWKRPAAADAIRRALVLSADHELNPSSFAARVIASTGASLTAAIVAGLAALSGPRHGRATESVAAFLDEVARTGDAGGTVRARLARGEPIPGFGHPLYPDGDPRALALLPHADRRRRMAPVHRVVMEMTGLHPTIDFALVTLERCHALPAGAALAIFAVGRSVGWIAHGIEQGKSGQLIRPRARFVASGDQ